jgi:hypothetical protein
VAHIISGTTVDSKARLKPTYSLVPDYGGIKLSSRRSEIPSLSSNISHSPPRQSHHNTKLSLSNHDPQTTTATKPLKQHKHPQASKASPTSPYGPLSIALFSFLNPTTISSRLSPHIREPKRLRIVYPTHKRHLHHLQAKQLRSLRQWRSTLLYCIVGRRARWARDCVT